MTLNHRVEGPEHGVPLILGPSLGTSMRVWDQQIGALARHHRVLRFDLPGHGGSGTPKTVTISELAGLVLDLAEEQGWDTFHYAGVSLGGAIGAHLAVHHPGSLLSLAMVCSSARFGEPEGWLERAALVREHGTGQLIEGASSRWFFDPAIPRAKALLEDLAGTDPEGYAACCDALASYDLTGSLNSISARTLVIAGRSDPATPPAHARFLADEIADASLVEVAGAAHLALAERPEPVTAALLSHLGTPGQDQYTQGMAVRRAVLGDAHVDRAVAATTDLTADFQNFITRYAWGEIWTRPGLDRRTRSCITLTALIAHGHHAELAMHLRAALTNGLTPDEIKEVLLQSAVYCGVPAANAAFAIAQEVLANPTHP